MKMKKIGHFFLNTMIGIILFALMICSRDEEEKQAQEYYGNWGTKNDQGWSFYFCLKYFTSRLSQINSKISDEGVLGDSSDAPSISILYFSIS